MAKAKSTEEPEVETIEPAMETPAPSDPPILPGYEGDTLDVVTLTGNGPGDGTFRVVTPLPLTVASNGATYVLSNRGSKSYNWLNR